MKSIIIQYILKRLSEASTIRGIILSVSAAIGITLQSQQTDSLVWIVLGIIGLVGTFFPDTVGKNKEESKPVEPKENVDNGEQEIGWGDK
jgi:hypothetical protein